MFPPSFAYYINAISWTALLIQITTQLVHYIMEHDILETSYFNMTPLKDTFFNFLICPSVFLFYPKIMIYSYAKTVDS